MHKIISSLALLALVAGASTVHPQKSRIGLKAGINLARYRGEDSYAGGATRTGFCAGLTLHLPINSVFSVQPEFLYSQKGDENQNFILSTGVGTTGNQRLSYVELPVLAKLRSHMGLFAEFGPTLAYLLSAGADFSQYPSVDNRSGFNSFEWGYAAGVGYQRANGFSLGIRYSGGLSPIFTAGAYKGYGINGEPRIYNRSIQLYVGHIFFGRPQAEFPQ